VWPNSYGIDWRVRALGFNPWPFRCYDAALGIFSARNLMYLFTKQYRLVQVKDGDVLKLGDNRGSGKK